ncbi:MAG: hypothetical protein ACREDR_29370 [Blastocatellia bacterium]
MANELDLNNALGKRATITIEREESPEKLQLVSKVEPDKTLLIW